MKILIVDDNSINQTYFSMALKKSGLDYKVAESGFEALEFVVTENIDLVLMDLRMPQMDGYETTQKIRAIEGCQNLPIIATSAELIDEAQRDLFNGFLMKPIRPQILVNAILEHKQNHYLDFDETLALNFAFGDKAIVNKLVTMFLKELPIQIKEIDSLINMQQWSKCNELIHKVRGSCKVCGAVDLDDKLSQLSVRIKESQLGSTVNFTGIELEQVKVSVANFQKVFENY